MYLSEPQHWMYHNYQHSRLARSLTFLQSSSATLPFWYFSRKTPVFSAFETREQEGGSVAWASAHLPSHAEALFGRWDWTVAKVE